MGQRQVSDGGIAVGSAGWEFINDIAEHAGPFGVIRSKDSMTISEIDCDNSNGAALTGESFSDKYDIFGTINTIKLSAGKCFAYKLSHT